MQSNLPHQSNACGIIYCTTNLVNGKKYIGQTRRRANSYIGGGKAFSHSIKKYGKENFVKEVLEDNIPLDYLNESEIYWIDYFNADKSDLFYNISKGGRGGDHGEEVCKRISEKLKGHKVTQETREKIRKCNLGRKHTDESKEKMKLIRKDNKVWNFGLARTEEVKNKIRATVAHFPILQIDIATGECKEWCSANQAKKYLNIDAKTIWNCATGLNSHCKNYFWIYKKDVIDGRINWTSLMWNYTNRKRISQSIPKIYRKNIFLFERIDKNELINTIDLQSQSISVINFNL